MKEMLNISVAAKRSSPVLCEAAGLFTDFLNYLHYSLPKCEMIMRTGLADGGDMICADRFLSWAAAKKTAVKLIGVYPFPIQDYLETIENRVQFRRLDHACFETVVLNGKYISGTKSTAKLARALAYRSQADFLIRHCDFLVAICDERDPLKAGGTTETVQHALEKGIKVVLISLYTQTISLLKPNQNSLQSLIAGQLSVKNLKNICLELAIKLNE